jgi:putative PIN family toxin of toxin-antitoxin system
VTDSGLRRVVLDTNVVVSALLFRQGEASQIQHFWQERLVQPLVSAQTTMELVRVLTYPKFRLSQEDREDLLSEYLPYACVVKPEERLSQTPRVPRCRDPFDDMFLELAQAGEAVDLVTGDRDLLGLNDPALRHMCFLIITPAQALKAWGH